MFVLLSSWGICILQRPKGNMLTGARLLLIIEMPSSNSSDYQQNKKLKFFLFAEHEMHSSIDSCAHTLL
jgi:hypothetical protein